MSTLLEAGGISASYPAAQSRRTVLKDVSLSLAPGSFLTVLGPSGCGKTTLLTILGGFLTPDSGTVTHEGRRVTRPEFSRLMIFQEFRQLFPWMTVIGNVVFALKVTGSGMSRSERETLARRYIDMAGMSGYEASYPAELSGGMKQRTALARALVTRPDILLMDEPFAGIDAPTRKRLRDLLIRLWKELEFSVVFVTHDIPEALSLSTDICLLSSGRSETMHIDMPYPRDEHSGRFIALNRELYEKISVS